MLFLLTMCQVHAEQMPTTSPGIHIEKARDPGMEVEQMLMFISFYVCYTELIFLQVLRVFKEDSFRNSLQSDGIRIFRVRLLLIQGGALATSIPALSSLIWLNRRSMKWHLIPKLKLVPRVNIHKLCSHN